ncbi:MAG: type I-C CRISPR-associated protein Cas8c/Csd1, partial [Agrobacterium sp.]|nr:type I-C CRISPR-associated protein Cas8c/Csd1 [Agrobacterium sp.]
MTRLHSVISSVGSGPDLDDAKRGQFWTPIGGQFCVPIDSEGKRTADEHAAFRARHTEWLEGSEDAGLLALVRFMTGWTPDAFVPPTWPDELRDQNIVFALSDEYRD